MGKPSTVPAKTLMEGVDRYLLMGLGQTVDNWLAVRVTASTLHTALMEIAVMMNPSVDGFDGSTASLLKNDRMSTTVGVFPGVA